MTKIEKWLRNKQVDWNKDVIDGSGLNEVLSRETKTFIGKHVEIQQEAVENFIQFAFSDDLCFIDEEDDALDVEPEDCEECKQECEDSGVEYESNFEKQGDIWICANCRRPV